MHYCVIFFYKPTWKTPWGHCDLLIRKDSVNYKFRWFDAKKVFRKVKDMSLDECLKIHDFAEKALVIEVFDNIQDTKYADYLFKTCSELTRLLSEVDIGICLTPVSLYKNLLKFDQKRNYKIIRKVDYVKGSTR